MQPGPDSPAAGPKAHKESGAPLPPLMVKCFVCILSMISYFFSSPAPAPACSEICFCLASSFLSLSNPLLFSFSLFYLFFSPLLSSLLSSFSFFPLFTFFPFFFLPPFSFLFSVLYHGKAGPRGAPEARGPRPVPFVPLGESGSGLVYI